ncbi:hypothetical protein PUNSTDRAFT_132077 [Punctularia strigosozonata HHB-11173 SS5]|uniref:uncharacterized protein n=1 Tax=Punctularia strigosozonata (strain HHB-11173) TaxID=741275 RepID=UPI000441802A|nr:uncharacterized protein PUNSTDRAFT_132077 [Punctularia strigosozonata HHB-11173 SS5]EIN11931.1 hypothetical protein PUNSTDRAFT_132077 [Punctularia strigosozonata HHB-11173 SS5]
MLPPEYPLRNNSVASVVELMEDALVMDIEHPDIAQRDHSEEDGFICHAYVRYEERRDGICDVQAIVLCPSQAVSQDNIILSLASVLHSNGVEHFNYYISNGDIVDALRFTVLFRAAIILLGQEHPERAKILFSLAMMLTECQFRHTDRDLLEEAIAVHRQVENLRPGPHLDRGAALRNFATSLVLRYERYGGTESLSEATFRFREALDLHPMGHPGRVASLNNLASCLQHVYAREGRDDISKEIMSVRREALSLAPPSHPHRFACLNNLANSISTHVRRHGDVENMDEAVSLYKDALELLPADHPSRGAALVGLANALRIQFDHVGDLVALEEAISVSREVASTHAPGHPLRANSLSNLANALVDRYDRTLDAAALDEVIALRREVVALYTEGHADRASSLRDLSSCLRMHYEHFGDVSSLDEAISILRDILEIESETHPDRDISLNNLANSLSAMHNRRQDPILLIEAINLLRETLSMRHERHPGHGMALSNLANCLLIRYEQYEDTASLDEAVELMRKASAIHSEQHPNRFGTLLNLHRALYHVHELSPNPDLAAEMHSILVQAEKVLSWGTGDRVDVLFRFSQHHLKQDRPFFDLSASVDYVCKAISYPFGSLRERLPRSQAHLQELEAVLSEYDGPEIYEIYTHLLEAYENAIGLMPRIAVLGLDPSRRLSALDGSQLITTSASSLAMRLGRLITAVELLEQGRAVFWSQALSLRTRFDELPIDLSSELARLSRLLEEDSMPETVQANAAVHARHTEHAARRRRQSEEFDRLVAKVRSIPGYERFLLPEPFDELAKAAISGPVVILTAGMIESHAIIIQHDRPAAHIVLPLMNATTAHALGASLRGESIKFRLLRRRAREVTITLEDRPRSSPSEADYILSADNGDESDDKLEEFLITLLERLWTTIVEPIVRELRLKPRKGHARPRLTWLPTGPFSFLPLHAAGTYTSEEAHNTSQYFVSSYTQTLSALLIAQRKPSVKKTEDVRALLVAEPQAYGGRTEILDGVTEEIHAVAEALPPNITTIVQREQEPPTPTTISRVIHHLSESTVLHLACHGVQNSRDPLQSAFKLGDGDLTIEKLMKLNLPDATFAFLSACDTGKGDSLHPDQVIHLAAALLFTGFRSVVATMWPMADDAGPVVAKHVYKRLFESQDGVVDFDIVPYALDSAVQKLRNRGFSAYEWALFVHWGA